MKADHTDQHLSSAFSLQPLIQGLQIVRILHEASSFRKRRGLSGDFNRAVGLYIPRLLRSRRSFQLRNANSRMRHHKLNAKSLLVIEHCHCRQARRWPEVSRRQRPNLV